MTKMIEIDPAHPVGSLTAGPQQFTIVADTDHGNPSHKALVAADLELAARNGVKVVLLEHSLRSVQTWETLFPEMADAKTWDERKKVLADYQALIEELPALEGRKASLEQGIPPDQDQKKWREAFDRGYEIGRDKQREFKIMISRSYTDLELHRLMEDVFTKVPPITDQEILERSRNFSGSHTDPKDAEEAAKSFADLFIKSRQYGLEIRMTGDDPPVAISAAVEKAEEAVNWHIEENPKYAEYLEKYRADPNTQIPDEDKEGMTAFLTKLNSLRKQENEALDALVETRDNPAAEQARVDRLIAAADGKKALVIWGQGHVNTMNDFDEMLDQRLKAQAARTGAPAPAPTAVIELFDTRKDYEAHMKEIKPGMDQPDVRFVIREKQVHLTPGGAERLELKPSASASAADLDIVARQLAAAGPQSARSPDADKKLSVPVPVPAVPSPA